MLYYPTFPNFKDLMFLLSVCTFAKSRQKGCCLVSMTGLVDCWFVVVCLLSRVIVFCRMLTLIRYIEVDFTFGPPNYVRYIEVRYIEVLFHTFYCNFGRNIENRSLYRGVCNIEVPLYLNGHPAVFYEAEFAEMFVFWVSGNAKELWSKLRETSLASKPFRVTNQTHLVFACACKPRPHWWELTSFSTIARVFTEQLNAERAYFIFFANTSV